MNSNAVTLSTPLYSSRSFRAKPLNSSPGESGSCRNTCGLKTLIYQCQTKDFIDSIQYEATLLDVLTFKSRGFSGRRTSVWMSGSAGLCSASFPHSLPTSGREPQSFREPKGAERLKKKDLLYFM